MCNITAASADESSIEFMDELDEDHLQQDIIIPVGDPLSNEIYRDFMNDIHDELYPDMSHVESINELNS